MLSVFVCGNAQKTPSPFQRGDRVVFLGNSITEGGHYHSYIWLYYITHFPDMRMRMYSAGTGGDSSWDMLERIEEDVYGKNPTVVTATFGMNDSGYFEYNGDNPTAFVERQMYRGRYDLSGDAEDHEISQRYKGDHDRWHAVRRDLAK